jgi:steroid delta-isomerase-like uncharacterized protein
MAVSIKTRDELDPEFVEDWANRMLEAFNGHDADAVAALCTEDVVWIDPSLSAPASGRPGVRAFVEATTRAFPDFNVEVTGSHLLATGEPRVFSPYRMTGTMLGGWEASNFAATGARISVAGVDQWTFRGELMCHYQTYYDSLDMARQLGILPQNGSRAERVMARLQHVQARFQRHRASRLSR